MSVRLASALTVIAGYALLVGAAAGSGCGGSGSRSSGSGSDGSASSSGGSSSGSSSGGGSGSSSGAPSDSGLGACACTEPAGVTTIYLGGPAAGSCPATFPFNGMNNDFFSYNDGTVDGGTPFVHDTEVGGCDSPSNCAFHASGGGFTGYGAGVGITLNSNAIFDGSKYGGIDVWLRGTTTGTRTANFKAMDNTLHVKFVTGEPGDAGADPREGDDYGGYCPLSGADAGACYAPCHLPWSGLSRDGFKGVEAGAPDPATDKFDPANLVKIQFEFSSYQAADSSVSAEPVSFNVWIDDVAFLPPSDM
jgi:hypothetical protein